MLFELSEKLEFKRWLNNFLSLFPYFIPERIRTRVSIEIGIRTFNSASIQSAKIRRGSKNQLERRKPTTTRVWSELSQLINFCSSVKTIYWIFPELLSQTRHSAFYSRQSPPKTVWENDCKPRQVDTEGRVQNAQARWCKWHLLTKTIFF